MLTTTITRTSTTPPYVEVGSVDYLAVCNAVGLLLFNLERSCWPDVWAAYDRLHEALGLPMRWHGFRSTSQSQVSLTHHVGRFLRSLGQADIIHMLAFADREFRRARFQYAEALENDVRQLTLKIESPHRYAEGSRGWEDKASDEARLRDLIAALATERMALAVRS